MAEPWDIYSADFYFPGPEIETDGQFERIQRLLLVDETGALPESLDLPEFGFKSRGPDETFYAYQSRGAQHLSKQRDAVRAAIQKKLDEQKAKAEADREVLGHPV